MADFIWLRPAWLIAIPLLLLWLWYLSKRQSDAGWQQYLSPETLRHLRTHKQSKAYYRYLAIPLVLTCIGLAGPTLTSLPTGTANSEHAVVLVLDLSPSMLAQDINPDRITQAQFKTIDILRQHREGVIGLIVYAATAYRVTPLTDDPSTIETLVPTLHPDIMPVAGSNVESAMNLAVAMLRESSSGRGEIIVITDGITEAALPEIDSTMLSSESHQYRLSILGIGTTSGATIPVESGVLTDHNQQPVIAKLNSAALSKLSRKYDGRYAEWTTDSADIIHLTTQRRLPGSSKLTRVDRSTMEHNQAFDRYQDLGYWLILPLLFFAIYAFKKNVIYVVFPLVLLSPPAESFELRDIWLTRDQQAMIELNNGNFESSQSLFTRNEWKAIAAYRQGLYDDAALLLATPLYAEDLYNRGNAQALSGEFQAALKSYTQALLLHGDSETAERADILHNINVLKTLIDLDQREENSDGPQNRESGSNDNGEGPASDADDSPQNTDADDNQSQSQVGGAVDPDQTLDQQSLKQNGSSNSTSGAEADQPDSPPLNASERPDPQTTDPNPQNQLNSRPALPSQGDESSNPVLSPYSEQWLRELPQDPGGYLRRKFQYLYQTRQSEQPDQSNSPTRY